MCVLISKLVLGGARVQTLGFWPEALASFFSALQIDQAARINNLIPSYS